MGLSQLLIIGHLRGMELPVGVAVSMAQRVDLLEAIPDEATASVLRSPDLILVCQHWSEEFTADEVLRLITLWPLARIVCCYGPWCASDGRTRTIWPAALRVSLEAAPARIRLEAEVAAGQRDPLPLTASLDEVFAFDAVNANDQAHSDSVS